jgi:hypothetical protein
MSKLMEQFDAAAEVAREAFAAGDKVTGIAAIQLAAQLVQIARLLGSEREQKSELAGQEASEQSAYDNLSH